VEEERNETNPFSFDAGSAIEGVNGPMRERERRDVLKEAGDELRARGHAGDRLAGNYYGWSRRRKALLDLGIRDYFSIAIRLPPSRRGDGSAFLIVAACRRHPGLDK